MSRLLGLPARGNSFTITHGAFFVLDQFHLPIRLSGVQDLLKSLLPADISLWTKAASSLAMLHNAPDKKMKEKMHMEWFKVCWKVHLNRMHLCWELVFHQLYSSSLKRWIHSPFSTLCTWMIWNPLSSHNLKIFPTHIRISLPCCLPSFTETISSARRDILALLRFKFQSYPYTLRWCFPSYFVCHWCNLQMHWSWVVF